MKERPTSEEEFLEQFKKEVREGNRAMWPNWVKDEGERIDYETFHLGTATGEIDGSRVIENTRTPHENGVYFGKEKPWTPTKLLCYGWIETEDGEKLVYSDFDREQALRLSKESREGE